MSQQKTPILVRDEIARVLSDSIPDAQVRSQAVDWLFQSDTRAPYELAIEGLSGIILPAAKAKEAWRCTVEIQHGWSTRLKEPVTLKAAAAEAVVRCLAMTVPDGDDSSPPSLRAYLDRDMLTGLYNRSYYDARMSGEIANAASSGQPLTLARIDLCDVGVLNKTLGHAEVDDLLRSIGRIMRQHFGPTDLPCRMGGVEFAVIMPATEVAMAKALADELIGEVKKLMPGGVLSATAGIATYPRHAENAAGLLHAAEEALAQAGSAGVATLIWSPEECPDELSAPKRGHHRSLPLHLLVGAAAGMAVVTGYAGVRFLDGSRTPAAAFAADPTPASVVAPSPASALAPTHAPKHASKPTPPPTSVPVAHPEVSSPAQDPVQLAAAPRAEGDYKAAVERLKSLEKNSSTTAGRVRALVAAACAQAAAGGSPVDLLHRAASLAPSAPAAERQDLISLVDSVRGQWSRTHGSLSSSAGTLTHAIWASPGAPSARDASAVLIDSYVSRGANWKACTLADGLVSRDPSPSMRAAYGILAASSISRTSDVRALFLLQPAATNAPGPLGQLVNQAVAHAFLNGWRTTHATWQNASASMTGWQSLPAPSAIPLRLALADRLLETGDAADAHAVLQPLLTSEATSLLANDHTRGLVLDGLALWKTGSPAAARKAWSDAAGKISQQSPDTWSPFATETFWPRAASVLLGRTSASQFTSNLTVLDANQQDEGYRILNAVRMVDAPAQTTAGSAHAAASTASPATGKAAEVAASAHAATGKANTAAGKANAAQAI